MNNFINEHIKSISNPLKGLFKKLYFAEQKTLLTENGEKSIFQAIYNDDVRRAFYDFARLVKNDSFTVIGGLVVGVYSTPRNTQDIDIVVLHNSDIVEIEKNISSKFKKVRGHSFIHKDTHVELEIITPEFIGVSRKLVADAISNSKIDSNGLVDVRVVSPKYFIALKLQRATNELLRKSHTDWSDIREIISKHGEIDLTDIDLTEEQRNLYIKLCNLEKGIV